MLFLASDHKGFELSSAIQKLWNSSKNFSENFSDNSENNLENSFENKNSLTFLTPILDLSDDYPDIAGLLVQNLETDLEKLENSQKLKNSAKNSFGLAICGTGIGISIALNRFKFIRAGCLSLVNLSNLAENLEIVGKMREHNDANILCLGSLIEPEIAVKLFQKFIQTDFSQEIRHKRRIDKISKM